MKPKNRIICPDCGKAKLLFETEAKAKRFIEFNGNEIPVPGGGELKPYYCPACCGYHITHKAHKEVYDYQTSNLIRRYHDQVDTLGEKRVDPVGFIVKRVPNRIAFRKKKEVREYIDAVWPEIKEGNREEACNVILKKVREIKAEDAIKEKKATEVAYEIMNNFNIFHYKIIEFHLRKIRKGLTTMGMDEGIIAKVIGKLRRNKKEDTAT